MATRWWGGDAGRSGAVVCRNFLPLLLVLLLFVLIPLLLFDSASFLFDSAVFLLFFYWIGG
ncbi:hypothetical protein A2U01_0054304, partial [Trifolium medium]|nr:hypothetical protein [Trifolium medium]